MSRRDLFFFSLYFSSPLSFIFFYFLFFFLCSFLLLFHARENDAITNKRAIIGNRCSVFVSLPHRFRFLPPHAVCLFLCLPLWFVSPSLCRFFSLSLSLLFSLVSVNESALPNAFLLSRKYELLFFLLVLTSENWLKQRHAVVKFRDSAEQHAPFTASLVA